MLLSSAECVLDFGDFAAVGSGTIIETLNSSISPKNTL